LLGIRTDTVVNAGSESKASAMSSKPTIEMSCGICNPAFFNTHIAPSAVKSLAATIAVGSSERRRVSRAALCPPSTYQPVDEDDPYFGFIQISFQ